VKRWLPERSWSPFTGCDKKRVSLRIIAVFENHVVLNRIRTAIPGLKIQSFACRMRRDF